MFVFSPVWLLLLLIHTHTDLEEEGVYDQRVDPDAQQKILHEKEREIQRKVKS